MRSHRSGRSHPTTNRILSKHRDLSRAHAPRRGHLRPSMPRQRAQCCQRLTCTAAVTTLDRCLTCAPFSIDIIVVACVHIVFFYYIMRTRMPYEPYNSCNVYVTTVLADFKEFCVGNLTKFLGNQKRSGCLDIFLKRLVQVCYS